MRKSLRLSCVPACIVAGGLILLLRPTSAVAQLLPSGPIALANGHVTVAGDVLAAFGPEDPGFFNFTDYERSALRLFQVDLAAAIDAGPHATVLGQVRTLNADSLDVLAFYLRIRPWSQRRLLIQVGRIPRTFGAFPRRAYGADNFLIGYPLVYQYLISLRPDSVPATTNELVAMRGRGWRSSFSTGNRVPAAGVPLATTFHWDTGIQAHAASERIEVAVALATGSLSNSDVRLRDGLHRLDGRLAVHPVVGLVLGISGSQGRFITGEALDALPASLAGRDWTQRAIGADLEYSRGYYLIRAEVLGSRWMLPIVNANPTATPLDAMGVSIEGRYKIRPALFAGARFDHLTFSQIASDAGRTEWEAPVSRIEAGAGYALQRNLQLKASCQRDTRPATRVSIFDACAGQLLFWF